jgi:uncharacterized protein (TIGR02246 family)
MTSYEPERLHLRFVKYFNQADVDSLADLYEPNAILSTRTGKSIGREAIREAYREILAGGGQIELQTLTVLASSDGLALLHSAWAIHRDGKTTSGVSTELARKQADSTWLFVLDEPRTPNIAGS